jgi:thioredoxin-dependent peroxiredoxin
MPTTLRRLAAGNRAPAFVGQDVRDQSVALEHFRGKPLWLAMFRYAACPFCNWRVHRLVREQERIAQAGITLIAVFPSPAKRVTTYVTRYKPAFTVVVDPTQRLYELYRAETSWTKELQAAANVVHAARVLAAAPNNPFAIDGPLNRMPAEFLIDADQNISVAHYGATLDDGIDVDAAIDWSMSDAA